MDGCEICYWNCIISQFKEELRFEEGMEYSQIHDINLSIESAYEELKKLRAQGVDHTCGEGEDGEEYCGHGPGECLCDNPNCGGSPCYQEA
jgi:hypothetical protein